MHYGLNVVFDFRHFTAFHYHQSSLCKTAHWHWPHVNVWRVSCGSVFNMLLVLSIAFYFHHNIWGCIPDSKVHEANMGPFWGQQYQVGPMLAPWTLLSGMYSTGPFQCRWLKGYIYSSCYYHHQIGSTHLSDCCHIFPWLCVWGICYIIFCYSLHIHSGKTGNLFSLFLSSLW